jgi:nucleoside-diphosphate-sugar epimerase
VARALIVGCGCRGRALGRALADDGWQVRGTSRSATGVAAIERAGIEPARADPDGVGSLLDHVADVAVVAWLLGSAQGNADDVNGPRLQRMLELLVDTPVRGFVYEGEGSAPAEALAAGARLVEAAARRWRIPVAVVDEPPHPHEPWVRAMAGAARGLLGSG